MRRVEIVKLEEGYLVKVWTKTAPEAYAVQVAAQAVAPTRAFQPNSGSAQPNSGIPFDPPEWPETIRAETSAQMAYTDPHISAPPNCDGFGDFVMGAQLDDAMASDGDGCGIGLCVKRDEP